MRILFQGHRGKGANTNQSLQIRDEARRKPSAQHRPVTEASPSPLVVFGFATLQGPFYAFLGFLNYCCYGNE